MGIKVHFTAEKVLFGDSGEESWNFYFETEGAPATTENIGSFPELSSAGFGDAVTKTLNNYEN